MKVIKTYLFSIIFSFIKKCFITLKKIKIFLKNTSIYKN